jgi:hypothetical protein
MKSSDIKNWRYELSYSEMVELEDFTKLLTDAISQDSCLLCGGDKVNHTGLCIGCSMQTENKKVGDKVGKDYEILVTVRKRLS